MQLDCIHQQIRQNFESKHLDLVQRFVGQPGISSEGLGMTETAELVTTTIRDLGGTAQGKPLPEILLTGAITSS